MIIETLKREALKAFNMNEVPVSCAIIMNNKIIATAFNKTETQQTILNHAELICLEKTQKKYKSWRLKDCELYVTLEPCLMCASAIIQSRIKKIYYCSESKFFSSEERELLNLIYEKNNVELIKIDDNNFSKNLLSEFFKSKR
jgi:Cytosine/adenosine deaminases